MLLGSILVISSAPASATKNDEIHRSCTITLAPITPDKSSSRILGNTCTFETYAQTEQRIERMRDAALVVFWSNVDLTGTSAVVSEDATCDDEGYGISEMGGVHETVGDGGVSSYELLGSCDTSEKFSDEDFEGTSIGLIFGKEQKWVGTAWNDGQIKSFWLLDG